MASSKSNKPSTSQEIVFKTTLVDIAKLLTENDCKTLAFECTVVDRADRDNIKDGIQLLDKLESAGFVSMKNVDSFIELLRKRNLIQAACLLEEYRNTFIRRDSQSVMHEPGVTVCYKHPRYELDRHCKTCVKVVCIECVLCEHKNCLVENITDVPKAITEQRRALQEALKSANEQHKDVKDLIAERISSQSERRTLVYEEIERSAAKAIRKIEAERERLLATVSKHPNEHSGFKNVLQIKSGNLEIIRLNAEKMLDVSDQDIGTLTGIMENIASLDSWSNSLREMKDRLKEPNVDISSRIIENDHRFCEVTDGRVVGGVMIKPDQCVHIIDQRENKRNILLRCFNPKDRCKEHWTHNYQLECEAVPVVMSHRAMYYNSHFHIIFAVGKKVYVVDFNSSDGLYDSVKKIQPLTIKVVDESSWITSIYAHHSTKANGSEFLAAVSGSRELHKCDVSKGAFGTIDISSIIESSSVSCVAYSDNTYAIIEKGDVILFTADGNVKRVDQLKPPEYSSTSLALAVFWTGARWLVLWVDGPARKEWNVVMYKPHQKRVEQVHHGTACMESGVDIPVSITNTERDGFVSLANNSVSAFKF